MPSMNHLLTRRGLDIFNLLNTDLIGGLMILVDHFSLGTIMQTFKNGIPRVQSYSQLGARLCL